MKQFLDAGNNALTSMKSTDVIIIKSIVAASKAEENTLSFEGKDGTLRITTMSDALDEDDRHNLTSQAVIGVKEGATKAISILIGSNATRVWTSI